MAKKVDNIIKDYLSKNDRFKDILNYYLFKGRQVVKESDLKELDTTLVNTEGDIFENFRDLFKEVCIVKENRKNTFLLIGIENQTRMDYEMVSRVFLYDALSLRKVFKNNDKVKPIITIVIYYGEKKWDCPKSLYDYYSDMDEDIDEYMDDELSEFMPNYFINVIEPYQMTDDDINKFKSDFRIVCDFIRKSKNIEGIESIRKNNDKIEDETIDLINYITNSNLVYDKERGIDSMCKGLDEFEKRAKNEGRAEGETKKLNENIKTMHSNGFDAETIARALSLDINYVKEVLSK